MKAKDLDLLCAALVFTAVAVRSDSLSKDGAQRAAGLAYLTKELCRSSVPDAFAALENEQEPEIVSDKFSSNVDSLDVDSTDHFPLVDRMALTLTYLMRETNGCLSQDLIAKGFAFEEIDRHWPMAKALARVELNMMDS